MCMLSSRSAREGVYSACTMGPKAEAFLAYAPNEQQMGMNWALSWNIVFNFLNTSIVFG